MTTTCTKCTKPVDEAKSCKYCKGRCVKNGTSYNKQRYLCKACNKTFVSHYSYNAYEAGIDTSIKAHVKEGNGIRSISRLLCINTGTVLRRIKNMAKLISKPPITFGREYELDELRTFIKKKSSLLWIVYAIRKDTKQVIDFAVGSRTNQTIKQVTDTLLLANARKVYTDKLINYRYLIPKAIHSLQYSGTNHIERMNLNIRKDLKRLNRRTLCFSKSILVLAACLKIYFWG